jgi:hypothetical protein
MVTAWGTAPPDAVGARVLREVSKAGGKRATEQCTVMDPATGVEVNVFKLDVLSPKNIRESFGVGRYRFQWCGADNKPIGMSAWKRVGKAPALDVDESPAMAPAVAAPAGATAVPTLGATVQEMLAIQAAFQKPAQEAADRQLALVLGVISQLTAVRAPGPVAPAMSPELAELMRQNSALMARLEARDAEDEEDEEEEDEDDETPAPATPGEALNETIVAAIRDPSVLAPLVSAVVSAMRGGGSVPPPSAPATSPESPAALHGEHASG